MFLYYFLFSDVESLGLLVPLSPVPSFLSRRLFGRPVSGSCHTETSPVPFEGTGSRNSLQESLGHSSVPSQHYGRSGSVILYCSLLDTSHLSRLRGKSRSGSQSSLSTTDGRFSDPNRFSVTRGHPSTQGISEDSSRSCFATRPPTLLSLRSLFLTSIPALDPVVAT